MPNEIAEDIPLADALQLEGIAEQDEPRGIRERLEQDLPEMEVDHRAFVNDEHLARKRRRGIMAAAAGRGIVAEQSVERGAAAGDPQQ